MKLGFVSAILPDLSFDQVLAFAAAERFACVEIMCWPVGKAEPRYAGVTHIDVSSFTRADAKKVKALSQKYGVKISGCTVHFVDEDLDHGAIILQKAVEVLDGDTAKTFSARILEHEHALYIEAIKQIVEGKIQIDGRKVLQNRALT